MRRIILFFILFFVYVNVYPQSGWFLQNSGTTVSLNDIFFINENTGYVVGYGGLIKSTTNGGTNWVPVSSPTTNSVSKLFFINATTGYVISQNFVYKTSNSGLNWALVNISTQVLSSIHFSSAEVGYICGYGGKIYRTYSSAGTSWQDVSLPPSTVTLYDLYFPSDSVGYIGGSGGMIYRTTNMGTNWIESQWYVQPNIDVFFPNVTTGYIGGGNGILKTTNAGVNWTAQGSWNYELSCIYFFDANTGYAFGSGSDNKKTTNGGSNWFEQQQSFTYIPSGCYFINASTGWICNSAGSIYKTVTGGMSTGITRIGNFVPDKFELEQNYPNPFNATTKIKYQISKTQIKNQKVQLVIFNSLGQEIEKLVNEEQNPGIYEVTFDAGNYSSGIYFYKLITNDYIETKKKVLIK